MIPRTDIAHFITRLLIDVCRLSYHLIRNTSPQKIMSDPVAPSFLLQSIMIRVSIPV